VGKGRRGVLGGRIEGRKKEGGGEFRPFPPVLPSNSKREKKEKKERDESHDYVKKEKKKEGRPRWRVHLRGESCRLCQRSRSKKKKGEFNFFPLRSILSFYPPPSERKKSGGRQFIKKSTAGEEERGGNWAYGL